VQGADATEVRAPTRGEIGPIGPVLAAAFLDDPVWAAVGPRRRAHRAHANRFAFWGIARASARNGARIRVAPAADGRIAGATIAFEPGEWPMPDRTFAWEAGWVLAAGPAPVIRAIRDDFEMRRNHVTHPHLYLWFVGVDPGLQGCGVGRRLMADLHRRSEELRVPTYLETGTESNVGFYESLGYALLGQLAMPSGATLWRMERPSRGGRPAPAAAGSAVRSGAASSR